MKNKRTVIKITVYLTVGLLFTTLTGTQTKIDSLKKVIETADQDTTKAKAMQQLAWTIMYSDPDTAQIIGDNALKLLGVDNLSDLDNNDPHALPNLTAGVLNTLGVVNKIQSNYPRALEYFFKALKIREERADKKGMAASYNNIGVIYYNQSDYPRALEYYFKALKIQKELGAQSIVLANTYNNIGIIYADQSDYPRALEYFFKSLKIKEELGNKQGMARSYTNIGGLYTSIYEQGDASTGALAKVDSLAQRAGGWAPEAPALLDTAMYYRQKALAIDKELSDEYGLIFDLSGIADIYCKKENYSHALTYYQEAALLADSIGALQPESEAHSGLAECYEKLGNHKLALEHYKQYSTLKDSVFNEEKSKDLGKLEARHEFEMAETKRKQKEKEQARILTEKIDRRNLLQYSGALIFIVALLIAITFSGKLNIPVRLAEGIIFFTFLLLFEFILVYLDPYVDNWTGGEPAYKLAINAGLAGLIFPLHSFFETKMKRRIFKTK